VSKPLQHGSVSVVEISEPQDRQALGDELDKIFFAASATQSFPDATARQVFRERWLGRYLKSPEDCLFVARDAENDGAIAGYIVGSFADPARVDRFNDIGYFKQLRDLTKAYPAHLHVNLHDRYRNLGLGGELVSAFAKWAQDHGASGVHVVTGAASRNLSFYARNRFANLRELTWNDHNIVFLGRDLRS
jgi:GNAT superfamily N-acetyltransferase